MCTRCILRILTETNTEKDVLKESYQLRKTIHSSDSPYAPDSAPHQQPGRPPRWRPVTTRDPVSDAPQMIPPRTSSPGDCGTVWLFFKLKQPNVPHGDSVAAMVNQGTLAPHRAQTALIQFDTVCIQSCGALRGWYFSHAIVWQSLAFVCGDVNRLLKLQRCCTLSSAAVH